MHGGRQKLRNCRVLRRVGPKVQVWLKEMSSCDVRLRELLTMKVVEFEGLEF